MNTDDKLVIPRLHDIILTLRNTALKSSLNVSDDMLFQCANKLYISENIQNSKTLKKTTIKPELLPATQKQINFLNKLRVKIPQNITKFEANALIKENTN